MLQLNFIREHEQEVVDRLAVKNFEGREIIRNIVELDDKRRETQKQLDDIQAQSNLLAREIGFLIKSGKNSEANLLKEKTGKLKEQAKGLEVAFESVKKALDDLLVRIPNLPHSTVPRGKSPEDNVVVLQEGSVVPVATTAVPHWDLTTRYDLIDFITGNKITGAGFPLYKGKGARLQRALINFFLDEALRAGYQEVQPPYLVNAASAFATGQLPDKDAQMYYVGLDDLYLIPTAEVPVTNIYRDTILKIQDLPVMNVAYSACFRREAGSYGKDVRGLNRLHQFDKVEIVQIAHPDSSYEILETMREYVSGLLRKLELPFRIVKLCGGDMGFTSALTYDMEVWSPAQARWLEVSSISNFETFQSNRLKLRFKDETGKIHLAHTLNGSALALPRIVAALLENFQTPEGIRIPEALIPYTGFEVIK
ncbi:MAG: serine--tRNA ligase [Bacteroidales bacterium]|jgi:seryl-tRNA synthetase|nr:serine--tRNA ligase [Bacteroidales bacterium]